MWGPGRTEGREPQGCGGESPFLEVKAPEPRVIDLDRDRKLARPQIFMPEEHAPGSECSGNGYPPTECLEKIPVVLELKVPVGCVHSDIHAKAAADVLDEVSIGVEQHLRSEDERLPPFEQVLPLLEDGRVAGLGPYLDQHRDIHTFMRHERPCALHEPCKSLAEARAFNAAHHTPVSNNRSKRRVMIEARSNALGKGVPSSSQLSSEKRPFGCAATAAVAFTGFGSRRTHDFNL